MSSSRTTPEQLIARHPLLGKQCSDALRKMASSLRLATLRKGEFICRESTPVVSFWLLQSGEVKLVRHTTKGQSLLIDIILPEEVFGLVFYDHHPVYPYSAVALKDTTCLAFPVKAFQAEAENNGELAKALLQDTCLRLCHSLRMRGLLLEEAPSRVATLLLNLFEKFGRRIPETRAVLAELSGVTVETAIRITRALAEEGILETRRGSIEILDLDAVVVIQKRRPTVFAEPITAESVSQLLGRLIRPDFGRCPQPDKRRAWGQHEDVFTQRG